MVYSLRDRNISATSSENCFLGVLLKALNSTTTAMSADLSPSETGSSLSRNISSRNGRRTRYVVGEVVEESSPEMSSQSTTFTALSSSGVSSLLSPTITPMLSSTTRSETHVASPSSMSSIANMSTSEGVADQSSNSDIANKSAFFLTLGACIDDIVFENASQRKGVSLYVIKKYLQEKYCYDTWHFRKSIRNYIVEALANFQLEQVSGRGANGSVRLSQRYRRKFMRAKLQLDSLSVDKVSNKSRSIQHKHKSNKNTNFNLDSFSKTTRSLNLTNLTSIRLNQRLITAKRKTLTSEKSRT